MRLISGDRLLDDSVDGVYVIIPRETSDHVPTFCPVCSCLMKTRDDEDSYRAFNSCSWCADKWARVDREKWTSGWRPDKSVVENALSNREKIATHIET